ncbi:hypothetical protein GCM10027563_30030 [Parasphingorhabdus pacifica]
MGSVVRSHGNMREPLIGRFHVNARVGIGLGRVLTVAMPVSLASLTC